MHLRKEKLQKAVCMCCMLFVFSKRKRHEQIIYNSISNKKKTKGRIDTRCHSVFKFKDKPRKEKATNERG
jgi:hypothetical protein